MYFTPESVWFETLKVVLPPFCICAEKLVMSKRQKSINHFRRCRPRRNLRLKGRTRHPRIQRRPWTQRTKRLTRKPRQRWTDRPQRTTRQPWQRWWPWTARTSRTWWTERKSGIFFFTRDVSVYCNFLYRFVLILKIVLFLLLRVLFLLLIHVFCCRVPLARMLSTVLALSAVKTSNLFAAKRRFAWRSDYNKHNNYCNDFYNCNRNHTKVVHEWWFIYGDFEMISRFVFMSESDRWRGLCNCKWENTIVK